MKYKVQVYVKGGMTRPPCHPITVVYANDPEEAAEKAKRDLRSRVFPDVWISDMHIESVERMWD